ncbi:MAG: SEC-C metal-binding domain-containing protein, partial [Mariprofundaceae bacterium]|nr:SEC-C metal-binding domain-containing protein [Mariprofundaceae bacterium]
IENSQKKVEGRNFDIRKQLLEYDDVMNKQREVIYEQRRELLEADSVHDVIEDMSDDFADRLGVEFLEGRHDEWNIEDLEKALLERLGIQADIAAVSASEDIQQAEDMAQKLTSILHDTLAAKEAITGTEQMRGFEKWLILQVLDHHWKEHLLAMDHLRQSVGLRGYAQKQPIQEYKRESFELFERMLGEVREQTMRKLYTVEVDQQEPETPEPEPEMLSYNVRSEQPAAPQQTVRRDHAKVGRNEPCPCGSGKKYKQCHGKR